MNDTSKSIKQEKEEKRILAKQTKLKEKQLEKRRNRIYNEMIDYQKRNMRKLKHAPQDAYISLRNINKIYDNKVQAVYDFNLDIKQHEFIVFVGPSGCGKSTTLRMIAGLEDITAGDLFIDGTYANDLHPKDRDIAMVFQSYALYPHMNVGGNMAFGLKIRKVPMLKVDDNGNPILKINYKLIRKLQKQVKYLKKYLLEPDGENIDSLNDDIKDLEEKIEYLKNTPVEVYQKKHLPKDEIHQRVIEAAKILQIEDYLNRKPKALSGGQCQRVALGRAIVRNAKVFLMDEPLSNLDAKLRVSMRSEIIRLHKRLGATTIYVTHDQTEAMTMADRIVVMKGGYIQQIGSPIEIYNYPANMFVATFIGSPAMNLLNVKYTKGTIEFDKGYKLKLDSSFKKCVENFYNNELTSLKEELKQLEDNFIEKKQYLEKINSIKNKESIDDKSQAILKKLEEELKYCEESNEKRSDLIEKINKIEKINLNGSIPLVFGIRPEDIHQVGYVFEEEKMSNEILQVVTVAELLGHDYFIHTDFEGSELVAKISAKRILNSGDEIKLVFDLNKIHLFDSITQKLIK